MGFGIKRMEKASVGVGKEAEKKSVHVELDKSIGFHDETTEGEFFEKLIELTVKTPKPNKDGKVPKINPKKAKKSPDIVLFCGDDPRHVLFQEQFADMVVRLHEYGYKVYILSNGKFDLTEDVGKLIDHLIVFVDYFGKDLAGIYNLNRVRKYFNTDFELLIPFYTTFDSISVLAFIDDAKLYKGKLSYVPNCSHDSRAPTQERYAQEAIRAEIELAKGMGFKDIGVSPRIDVKEKKYLLPFYGV